MSDVRAFAEAFFVHFGARAFPLDDNLVVDLPPDLATAFGKERLYLVFAEDGVRRELSPVEDLVVYGSRTFDRMLALLAGRGEVTAVCLPVRFDAERAPLPLHNCLAISSQVEPGQMPYYVVNYRAVYLSDEKQEEFLTVVLDAEGLPRPDKPLFTAESAEFAEILRISSAPSASSAVESSVAERLPDKKTLRRMLDVAGDVARRQADARAAELETAIQPRLQKGLLRLTTFYRRLAAEVDSGDPAQDAGVRADLERDLARKIADELESHRLRVTLSPLSCAVVLVPVAHYRLTLATRQTQHSLELDRDLYTGQIEGLACHACHKPVDRLALCDRQSHAVHPDCLDTCARCGRDVCRACGIRHCVVCDSLVCFDCIAVCAVCDRWQCTAHVTDCPVCGQPVCPACTATCTTCEVSQCGSHVARCATCGNPTCEEHRWPCYICGREVCETHADICILCGEPYCSDHGFHCRTCRQAYCSQCERDRDGECKTCYRARYAPGVPASSLPPIPGLEVKRYRWRRAGNRKFSVYKGWRLFDRAVVVVDKAGRVLYSAEVSSGGWLGRLLSGR